MGPVVIFMVVAGVGAVIGAVLAWVWARTTGEQRPAPGRHAAPVAPVGTPTATRPGASRAGGASVDDEPTVPLRTGSPAERDTGRPEPTLPLPRPAAPRA
ncbi:hypothetical protein, partial [Nocardioides sp. ChNu-99]